MLPVLDLDPVLGLARSIRPVAVFRHQALEPKLASLAKQVRSNLALFEVAQEDSIRPAG
jgi:hypothetical protein